MKSKKRWFVTALTACLTLSLGICAEALEYDFDGVEDTEYYPSTSYESLYGAKYNYGGSNATDYQWPALPYGVSSNTSVGCMEKVRFPGLVGSIGGSGIESNITNPIQQEPQIPSTSYQPSAYTSVDGMERKDGSIGTLKIPSLNINMKVWEGETNTSMAKGLGHYSSTSGWNGNNEVNYLAFSEISEGYHDELYGYLEEQGWLNEYKQGKTTVSYKKINTNGTTREQQICMTEYIRHQIHHPENTYNARFNDLQLRRSIEDMRAFVTSKAQTSGTT